MMEEACRIVDGSWDGVFDFMHRTDNHYLISCVTLLAVRALLLYSDSPLWPVTMSAVPLWMLVADTIA